MEKSIRYLLITVGFLFCASYCFGQKNAQNDADNAFNSGKYEDAIVLYKKALSYISEQHNIKGSMKIKAAILFQIGECYRMIRDLKWEVEYYQKALKAKCADSVAAEKYIQEAEELMPKYKDASTNYQLDSLKKSP